ncbi:hypothetical protein QNS29_002731 [Vibrio parahaemolyticus]|nr:hypothetical protein [Vibrio parahaemolyticus]
MSNTYITTITIATMPFGHIESDERIENLARAYMQKVREFFEEKGLLDKVELEGFWKGGCCIVRFLVRIRVLPQSALKDPAGEQVKINVTENEKFAEEIAKDLRRLKDKLKLVSIDPDPAIPKASLRLVKSSKDEVTSNDSGKLGKPIKAESIKDEVTSNDSGKLGKKPVK